MKTDIDYYAVLGVLPNAEAIVVSAAYRALASLYHPDRWNGDPAVAHARMAEINVAYGVLGDAAQRPEYDRTIRGKHGSLTSSDGDGETAFDSALREVDERWQIAVAIYPALNEIRVRLAKTSHRLAFEFVTTILETKQFAKRDEIASTMEKSFLVRYFGTNVEILDFARDLVNVGAREAIYALNRYVDVLGNQIEAKAVIQKIENDFELSSILLELGDRKELARSRENLRQDLAIFQTASLTRKLAELHGYSVVKRSKGWLGERVYDVTRESTGERIESDLTRAELVSWALRAL